MPEEVRNKDAQTIADPYMNPHVMPFFLPGRIPGECVLLIHGFTGSPAGMRPLAESLNKGGEGFSVRCMLLPGHGTDADDMLGLSWKKWYTAAAAEFRELRAQYPKVSVIGLSMGGNIALNLAATMDIHRLVTISTPIVIRNKLSYLAEFLSVFRKYQPWGHSAPLKGELRFDYEIGYSYIPVRSIAEVRKMTIASFNRLHRVKQPILIAQSVRDRTVSMRSPYLIYDRVSSEYRELLLLMNARHNAVLSPERQKLFDAVDVFLQKEIAPRDLEDKK